MKIRFLLGPDILRIRFIVCSIRITTQEKESKNVINVISHQDATIRSGSPQWRIQHEVAIGRVGFGFGWIGSGKFDQKNLSGHGSGFRSNTIVFFSGLGSFRVGPGRVSGSYELRSFRASGHSSPGRVGFRVI
jgi:hypothetical protein